jgi:hypothetical protein
MRQVIIDYKDYDGYNVSTSNNGSNWNVVYTDKDYKKAAIIAGAFKSVGHEDVSDYGEILGDAPVLEDEDGE